GKFEDVSAKAGLEQLKTVCLGAAFVDLDQDGDLDLVIAQYAALQSALAILKGEGTEGAGLAVFLNGGEALPAAAGQSAALTTNFTRKKESDGLLGEPAPAVGLVVADFDLDHDLDLLVLADRTPASVVVNDRLLRFHRQALPETLVPRGTWNGGLVLDVNH